jgi:hypothetical protein
MQSLVLICNKILKTFWTIISKHECVCDHVGTQYVSVNLLGPLELIEFFKSSHFQLCYF